MQLSFECKVLVFLNYTGVNDSEMGTDGLTVATLSYAMGPGANEELKSINETGRRRNLTEEKICEFV